jgi:ribose transport system permease protein
MNLKSIGIFGLFIGLVVFMTFMTAESNFSIWDSTFWQPNNVENLLRRTSMYGLLGIGVAFVIITGGIDLSIGSVVCLSGCLLALFLQVDYRALNESPVIQIDSKAKTILVHPGSFKFQSGDRVRLGNARRAKNAILEIEQVETVSLEDSSGKRAGEAWRLTTKSELSHDDDSGAIAKVYSIESFADSTNEGPAKLTLPEKIDNLDRRDRISLVHPTQGQKLIEVASVSRNKKATSIELQRELGKDFSAGWYAIPQVRHQRMPVPLALLSVLSIAALLGTIHGFLVTRVRLQPFVVTLCGLLIYRGISRWLVNDQPVGFGKEYINELSWLGSGKWTLMSWEEMGRTQTFGIPYPLFILVLVAIIASIFLNMTIWGRYLQALGRNEEAARFSGIDTTNYTLLVYVICTVAAALGGMLFALDSNSVSPSSFGNFFELYAIAAAVLGGCSLRGGEGTILGVVIGTAVMQVLNNLILLMKISDELEFAIIGLVILFGVAADELVRRIASRKRKPSPANN